VVGEGVPQIWGRKAEGPVSHGAEVGVWDEEKVGIGGAEASGDLFWLEKFFKVGGCISVYALVGEEGNLILCPESNGEPVKGTEDGCNVVKFSYSHQDSGSTVLYIL
jgi:hypothetical protein